MPDKDKPDVDESQLDLQPGQGADTPLPGPAAMDNSLTTVPVTVTEVVQDLDSGSVKVQDRQTVQLVDNLDPLDTLPDNEELTTADHLAALETYVAQGGSDQLYILRELGQLRGKVS